MADAECCVPAPSFNFDFHNFTLPGDARTLSSLRITFFCENAPPQQPKCRGLIVAAVIVRESLGLACRALIVSSTVAVPGLLRNPFAAQKHPGVAGSVLRYNARPCMAEASAV
jgi:hypothetical protein